MPLGGLTILLICFRSITFLITVYTSHTLIFRHSHVYPSIRGCAEDQSYVLFSFVYVSWHLLLFLTNTGVKNVTQWPGRPPSLHRHSSYSAKQTRSAHFIGSRISRRDCFSYFIMLLESILHVCCCALLKL